MLDERVPYFDPQLAPGQWNDEAAAAEKSCKDVCRFQVYVISPEGVGKRSFFEMGREGARIGNRMIFAAIGVEIDKPMKHNIADMREDGVVICESLEEIAAVINAAYAG